MNRDRHIPKLVVGLLMANCDADARASSVPQAPAGFAVTRAAAPDALRYPMFACFDDQGRLYVAESSGQDLYAELRKQSRECRISVLEDRDGDGVFEDVHVFADKLVFPMGLAWREGRLYVADPPDLVTLEDTDGDGVADKREVVLTGFGHQDNGSLHGLTFGPDGWLYFTMGTPDGYRLKVPGGGELRGDTGALLRCRADGSSPEALCSGFENLVEIVFLPGGEMIGTDNWFLIPEGGVRDALVDLAPGGLYPMGPDKLSPIALRAETLPPLALFPAVALSGLARHSGNGFPTGFRGNLYSAQHNSRKVARHVLTRFGSTFNVESHDFVWSTDPDFHPSDALEDADGSLLIVDTGGWYVEHCPTGRITRSGARGGLWRAHVAGQWSQTDPRGLQLDWRRASPTDLTARLDDPRAVVRARAREELVRRGADALAALESRLRTPKPAADTLWTLARIPSPAASRPLREALVHPEAEIAALAARCLGTRADKESAPALEALLASAKASVRRAVAEALASCGRPESAIVLIDALAREPDRFEEHALTMALHRCASEAALLAALSNRNARVQAAALLLLDPRGGLGAPAVAERLASSDPFVARVAQRILQRHREWAPAATDHLQRWLARPNLSDSDEEALIRFAQTFASHRPMLDLLGRIACGEGPENASRRAVALRLMSKLALDSVPESWLAAIGPALNERTLQGAALRAVTVLRLGHFDKKIAALVDEPGADPNLRLEAMRALVPRNPQLGGARFDFLLRQLRSGQDALARLSAAELLGVARLSDEQFGRLLDSLGSDAAVSLETLLPCFRRSASAVTARALLDLLERSLDRGWQPQETVLQELVNTLPAGTRGQALLERLHSVQAQRRLRLDVLSSTLASGDAARGRSIFFGATPGCGACHRVGLEGGRIGPDLTKIGAIRAGRDLLESIVYPSSTFAQGYEPWRVTTRDDEEYQGVLVERAAEYVVLRGAGGADVRIVRDNIRQMQRSEVSVMPEGLDRALTREQLRDLLAYLQSLK